MAHQHHQHHQRPAAGPAGGRGDAPGSGPETGRDTRRGAGGGTGRGRRRSRRRVPGRHSGARRAPSVLRALRREIPCTVAVLAREADFAALRARSAGFPCPDYPAYLRQMEGLLRSLAAQGRYVRIALFDPRAHARYCEEQGLDAGTPAARARYTAHVAALEATVAYLGQPLGGLLARLRTEDRQRLTRERANEVLAAAGICAGCGQDLGRLAFEQAAQALTAILDSVGPGLQHLVCSVVAEGSSLLATLHAECGPAGAVQLPEDDALLLCTVLAAALAVAGAGGMVVRTTRGGGDAPDVLRGWRLADGWLSPLTEAEVFAAYCTDPRSGEPIPPEPGVEYRAGTDLPPPADRH